MSHRSVRLNVEGCRPASRIITQGSVSRSHRLHVANVLKRLCSVNLLAKGAFRQLQRHLVLAPNWRLVYPGGDTGHQDAVS